MELTGVSRSLPTINDHLSGSSLLSVGSRETKLGGCEVEHGDEAVNGTKTASPAFDGGEDTVEAFEEGIGGFAFPVGQDARQVRFDHPSALKHASEE